MEVVDDAVVKIVGERQLQKYGRFMDDYAAQLQGIETALDQNLSELWNRTWDPISLNFLSGEQTTILKLINTDNKVLNKVITALAALCGEMDSLIVEAKAKYYNALLFYGEGESDKENDGKPQLQIGRIIPLLQELSCYVSRANLVVKNVIQQLSCLYCGKNSVINVSDVHFQVVFEKLGDLLTTLVTLDEIINSNYLLQEHWTLYKRMLKSAHANPTCFGTSKEKLKNFEKFLSDLETQVIEGRIFMGCIQQGYDDGKNLVVKNSHLAEEYSANIKSIWAFIDSRLGEQNELDARAKLVGLFSIYILYFYLYRDTDKRLFKSMWDIYKKAPAVPLIGNVLWFPDQFLIVNLPHMAKAIDKKAQDAAKTYRLNYLQQKSHSLTHDSQMFQLQVTSWLVKLDKQIVPTNKLLQELASRCNLLLQGLWLAWTIGTHVRTVLNLHVALSKAMNKTSVIALCQMIEFLKAIESAFHRQSVWISETMLHLLQHLVHLCLVPISSAKKRLTLDKIYNERNLDLLSALVLAETSLNGSCSKDRRLIAHLALSVGNQTKSFREEETTALFSSLRRLDLMCTFGQILKSACDCSFVYWHRVILPVYLGDFHDGAIDVHRLHYIFASLQDCIIPLSSIKHEESPNVLLKCFYNEMKSYLKNTLLEPQCRSVETDLRLNIHLHLQQDDRNPFRIGLKDKTQFLVSEPLKMYAASLGIKNYVENYLNETFYNLTTVALHDWRTYDEMRSLAEQKYALNTVEGNLPTQTLEQGLDVLEIMRNIHVFVAKYLYNLNNQIFVEMSSNNKHLNTINIRHIANSIRTHGIGIMNTTVNFIYQFLRKKFYIFSQFLYDDHIKSRLIKDMRYFRENKEKLEQRYSFDRAEKFNRGIRKLGVSPEGLSFLDQFRQLITQIGNAMGYIRMIRSGGLHCCSNAIRFVPDLDDIVNFEEHCKDDSLSSQCVAAAAILDSSIGNLTKNFSEGTEYFKLLVDVFAPAFQDSKNIHLRNFFIIVPPLTINFIEHSITCKESMNKKNKVGAAFTDDGFAMGVAYILKLLDQYHDFDSLHWFQSVREKYNAERRNLMKQNDTTRVKDDEKLQQTMTLTMKRLELYQQEFDLLNYSLSSARIFFRADLTAREEKDDKNEKAVPPPVL